MIKKGDKVEVDFTNNPETIHSSIRFSGYGVVDRFEDGRVFGRLDDGQTFMCFEGDVALIECDGEEALRENFEKLIASSPSYLKLVFQHGERLFIFEDGQYKIAAVQLAWELEQHRQSEINDLKQDYSKAKLSDIQHTTLAFDVINERDDLQKRVDELELAVKGAVTYVDLQIEATEQGREAAIGTQAKNWWSSKLLMLRPVRRVLEQTLKGGSDEAN